MVLKRSSAILLLALITLPQVHAAGPTSPIVFNDRDGITETLVPPPNVGSTGSGSTSNPDQWMKIEFHYAVVPQTAVPYVDAAEFKVWVEARDLYAPNAPAEVGFAVVLTGSLTYINMPAGHDAYGVFYIHPSTLARYSAKGGIEDFDRKFNVHIEASVGGVLSDYYDKIPHDPGGADWFKAPRAVTGLVLRQDQSPFVLADVDRYPAIKLPTQSQ